MINNDDTAFDVSRRISDLRKSSRLRDAFELADEALARWPGDVHVLRALAWCRYNRDIQSAGTSPGDIRRIVETAMWVIGSPLSPADGPYEQYDPTPFIAIHAARLLMKAERFNEVVTVLSAIDPARLSSMPNGDFDPPQTDWFRYLTKAHSELGQFEEITHLHSQASRARLQGDQVKWIDYRFHLAFLEVGRAAEALAILDGPLRMVKEPWMTVQRARTYAALDRHQDAIAVLRTTFAQTKGFTAFGYLIRGLELMIELLRHDDPARAVQHLGALIRTREANEWPIRESDRSLAASLGVAPVPADDATLKLLRTWWAQQAESERLTGRIKTVLPHGGAGFLVADDGREFYFAMPRSSQEPAPPVGTQVSFALTEGFDKKRNRATEQAHRLRRVT